MKKYQKQRYQEKQCENGACNRTFVPVRAWQRFCTTKCRVQNHSNFTYSPRPVENDEPKGEKINACDSAIKFIEKLKDFTIGKTFVIYLDSQNFPICTCYFTGIEASPKAIIKHALIVSAVRILLVHVQNTASVATEADELALKELKKISSILGIRILDNIIYGQTGYLSFAECKLL